MIGFLVAAALMLSVFDAPERNQAAPSAAIPSSVMSHAVGTFEVRITPVEPEPDALPGAPGRMRIAKTFHGGVEGTSTGQMLATLDDGQSGAYVALERVTATVDGRSGAFSLVHRGIMDRDVQELLITIVPGSGEGELAGITGVFHLTIAGGEHRYDLEYSLPEAP